MSMYPGVAGQGSGFAGTRHMIHSPLAPDAAGLALVGQITPRSWATTFFPLFLPGRFSGQVVGNHFAITRIIRGRSNVRIWAVGDIYPDGRGSLVQFDVRLDPWVLVGYAVAVVVMLLVSVLALRSLSALALVAVLSLVIGLFAILSYNWEVREVRNFLDNVFLRSAPWVANPGTQAPGTPPSAPPMQTQRLPNRWASDAPPSTGRMAWPWDDADETGPPDRETERLPPFT